MNRIALCIPAYNAATFLPRLLKSAMDQLKSFDEIIVYDDCSYDDTAVIAKKYGTRVIRGETNRGCSYGKNMMASKTMCEWIHFHDADDALYPNFVSLAHKWISAKNRPDVVLFDYEHRDNNTNELLYTRRFDKEALNRDPIDYAIREQINPFCGLYRRDSFLIVGGYDLDPLVLYNEDVAFHIRLAMAGLKFAAESATSIINYRIKHSMSSSNQIKCLKAQYQVMKKTAAMIGNKYADQISNRLWEIAGCAAAYLDWETADACVALAMKLRGNNIGKRHEAFFLLCLVNPYLAVRIREHFIRMFKPHLRRHIP